MQRGRRFTIEESRRGASAMWATRRIPIQDRFWSKVDKQGEQECWNWKAGKNKGGYGVFYLEHSHHNEPSIRDFAHRLSWQFANGPIPDGKWVLHKCDNPPCVNPNHLFVGTVADNQKDMAQKGRGSTHRRILTPDQVLEIRKKYVRGVYGYIRLAKEYGVGPSTIHDLIVKRNW